MICLVADPEGGDGAIHFMFLASPLYPAAGSAIEVDVSKYKT